MNIQNISKEKREVTLTLSADELVMICNMIFTAKDEYVKREKVQELHADMILARDLCQYGHIDNFSLGRMVAAREAAGSKIDTHMDKYVKKARKKNNEKE